MSELKCDWSTENFSATAVYTGENRLIRVQGTGTCPTTDYSVSLEATNPGFNPERPRIYLALVETAPEVGGDALKEMKIDELFDAAPYKTEVGIRHVGVLKITEPA
jgi:hypothetical protein